MASTSTYLNFPGTTEAAFTFYRDVFGTAFTGDIVRMASAPRPPGAPAPSAADQQLVMHVALPILGGHLLMGTDAVPSMGHTVTMGDNISLSLAPDTRAETDRLFAALSAGGIVKMPLQEMFWGAYWGSLTDKFGVHWMLNCTAKA
jgi:PhnB protein